MAEERTLGTAPARELGGDDDSKEALQRRMEEARDSISNTVTEIKDNVAQQYESVKDALDWREQFKKRPVAWTVGAAGVGFFVGYGIAAAITGDDDDDDNEYYSRPASQLYAGSSPPAASSLAAPTNGKDDGPGLIERFKETSAYDRLSKEVGSLGDRLVEELSSTAQQVVLPALLKKIKGWIGVDLSNKTSSMQSESPSSHSYEPSLAESRQF